MVDVAVIGVGQTKYGAFPEKDMKELFVEAFTEALADVKRGIDPKVIQEAFIGTLETGGNQLGNVAALMTEHARIPYIPARRVENACCSSGFAFRDAFLAIKTGMIDIVLAGGVEKMNDLPRERNRYWLGVSGDVEWERLAGTTFPGIYAMIALRHMHEYGTKKEQITGVAVKNHRNAARNPKAQLRFEITLERAMSSPMLAYPLTLFDVCPTTDGASVAILCRGELAKDFTDEPIYVAGSGAATDYLAIHDRKDITHLKAATLAAKQAYEQSGLKPADIDVAEVHDCFTIAEILAYESLGFSTEGQGGRLVTEGVTEIGGRIPVNPSGGLKAKGHPIGATGVGQVYEIVHQLRGDVKEEERQVRGAEVGLAHNVGGSGGTAVVHILRR
jgi:acetyl-CoA C-acetyltransferase/acetyl-CoA acyltransferase